MRGPPIPQRIPPLTWRRPAFVWTPLALALAIGWPAALFYQDGNPQRFTLITGAIVFAIALTTMGIGWAFGRPPKSRRAVVVHVVVAMAIAALAGPFLVTRVLAAVAEYNQSGASQNFTTEMSLAMTPLAVVIGLPIGLISGIVFAWVALERRRTDAHETMGDDMFHRDVQPFR